MDLKADLRLCYSLPIKPFSLKTPTCSYKVEVYFFRAIWKPVIFSCMYVRPPPPILSHIINKIRWYYTNILMKRLQPPEMGKSDACAILHRLYLLSVVHLQLWYKIKVKNNNKEFVCLTCDNAVYFLNNHITKSVKMLKQKEMKCTKIFFHYFCHVNKIP